MNKNSEGKAFVEVFKRYFMPKRWTLLLLLLLILLGVSVGSISPYLYGEMLDSGTHGELTGRNELYSQLFQALA